MFDQRKMRFAAQRIFENLEVFLREPVSWASEEGLVGLRFSLENFWRKLVELEVENELAGNA